jgi:hypothetical protein
MDKAGKMHYSMMLTAILRWLPVLIAFSRSAYTFYVFVIVFSSTDKLFCVALPDFCLANYMIYGNPAYKSRGACYIAFYALLLLISVPCYLMTACMNPGKPADVRKIGMCDC